MQNFHSISVLHGISQKRKARKKIAIFGLETSIPSLDVPIEFPNPKCTGRCITDGTWCGDLEVNEKQGGTPFCRQGNCVSFLNKEKKRFNTLGGVS